MTGGAIPLRSEERSNEEEAYFALSRWDRYVCSEYGDVCVEYLYRLLGFGACLLGAAACFFVSFLTLPTLAILPRKFALSFR
jgi:hypothetical protein